MADKTTDFTESTLTTKVAYDGRLLKVREDEVRTPDGKQARREWIHHPGAVVMLPMLDEDTVLLVRQYRYPPRRHFYELPAGKIDPGEEPLQTARRELREECGYEAGSWRHLATVHPCIGYSDERIELYLATDLARVEAAQDPDEFIDQLTLRLPLALEWVKAGRITDAKTIVGLMWADKFL